MTRAKIGRRFLSIGLGLILGVACVAADSWAATSNSTVTFDNQSGEPALVKLVSKSTDQTVEQVEVPSGATRTVHAPGGEYYLLARYGNDPAQYRYSKGDPFTITETATKYSETSITLHKVIDGNYHTGPSSKKEFEMAGTSVPAVSVPVPAETGSQSQNPSKIHTDRRAGNIAQASAPAPPFPTSASVKTEEHPQTAGTSAATKPTIRLKLVEEPGDADKLVDQVRTQVKKFLAGAGLTVVDPEASTFDADLELSVKGTALSAQYSYTRFGSGGTTYYSGARVSGRILFEASGGRVVAQEIWAGEKPTPYELMWGSSEPSGAPFQEALTQSNLWTKLGTRLQQGFGPQTAARYWEAIVEDIVADDALRATAFSALTSLGAPATSMLLRMMSGGLHVVDAGSALQRIGTPALPEILAALKSQHAAMRRAAARRLTFFGTDEVLPYLIDARKDLDSAVRANVIEALGSYQDSRVLPILKEALSDKDTVVRREAMKSLKKKGAVAVEILGDVLRNKVEPPTVRQEAAEALGGLGGPQAISPLIETLNDTIPYSLRVAIRQTVVEFDDPRVVPTLIKEVEQAKTSQEPLSSKIELRDLLKTKTQQDFDFDHVAWQQWFDGHEHKELEAYLGTTKSQADRLRADGLTQEALRDPLETIRRAEEAAKTRRYTDGREKLEEVSRQMADLKTLHDSLTGTIELLKAYQTKHGEHAETTAALREIDTVLSTLMQGNQAEAKTRWQEAREHFKQRGLPLGLTVGPTGVVLFTNATYVDYDPAGATAEASNLEASLKSLGHEVDRFENLAPVSLERAVSDHAFFLVPPLDKGNLYDDLGKDSRQIIKDFVEGGGVLVTCYPNSRLVKLLHGVFGFQPSFRNTSGRLQLDRLQTDHTLFTKGPDEIEWYQHMMSVEKGSLPSGAKWLYVDSLGNGVVVMVPFGAGKIFILSWDWFQAAPKGRMDGGWLKVLKLLMANQTT